jgi:uncharacterized HNH endonuclease L245
MYRIDEEGNVYSYRKNRFLKGGNFSNGYKFVPITIGGKTKNHSIHRIVAESFIPNPNNLPYVNHIDGNKRHNYVDNLEWCSAKENVAHAIRTGLVSSVCHVKKPVLIKHLKNGDVIGFDTAKDCCIFFGFTKCWLGNYQRKHGNPCVYGDYLISVGGAT